MTNTWGDEDRYWRATFVRRPYAAGLSYDVLGPGYRYGYEAASRLGSLNWTDIERELERGWFDCEYRGASTWEQVKDAVRDAWARAGETARGAVGALGVRGEHAPQRFRRTTPRATGDGLSTVASILSGAVAGAALALVLDPDGGGRRRRARARDSVTRAARRTRRAIDATSRHAANRARGFIAERRHATAADPADDRMIRERVRAEIGHLVSHPRAIDVDVQDGHVTLRGHVLASEESSVLTTVHAVRGVQDVTNALHAREDGEELPVFRRSWREAPMHALQPDWTPAARVALGAAASGLAAWGLARRDTTGLVAAAAGALLATQAATNAAARLAPSR